MSTELTAKDSLKILSTVDYLNSLDETQASIWILKYNDKITGASRDALLKELDKGVHKGIFNKPIETPADTTKLANTISASAGVMSSYAPTDRYKQAKVEFNSAVSNMNKIALNLQVIQDDYDTTNKLYLDSEERMNILVEDEYKDYPPAFLTLGLGKRHAFGEAANKNPELYKELKDYKQEMVKLDAQLGFKEHGGVGYSHVYERQNINTPAEKQYPFMQYKQAKGLLHKTLKALNIFEGDSSKTVLPEEFLEGQGYQTLTLEEE